MSFFSRLIHGVEKVGADVFHGVSAVTDVLSGNIGGAEQNIGAIASSFSKPKRLVSGPAPSSPSNWQGSFSGGSTTSPSGSGSGGATITLPPGFLGGPSYAPPAPAPSPSYGYGSPAPLPSPTGQRIIKTSYNPNLNAMPKLISNNQPMIAPAVANVTTTGATTISMNNQDMISFFNWLANHDWTGTWDMFLQMMQHPFSDWGTNLQNMYKQWLSQNYPNLVGGGSSGNLPMETAQVKTVVTHRASKPGYVVVKYNGQYIAVTKAEAKRFGWKPRHKPPISAKEWREAKAAKKVEHRIKKVAEELDMVAEKRAERRHRDYRNRHSKKEIEEAVVIEEKTRRR